MSKQKARANDYAQAIVQAMLERWQSALVTAADALKSGKSDVESALPKGSPAELVNVLKLMADRGDLDLVKDVAASLGQVLTGRGEAVKAEVTSAADLAESEQEQLRKSLAEQYGEDLTFSFKVDPSLLGGLRVRVGDRLIDTSVASRLAAMRESLASVMR